MPCFGDDVEIETADPQERVGCGKCVGACFHLGSRDCYRAIP
jgi:hypothetical protein